MVIASSHVLFFLLVESTQRVYGSRANFCFCKNNQKTSSTCMLAFLHVENLCMLQVFACCKFFARCKLFACWHVDQHVNMHVYMCQHMFTQLIWQQTYEHDMHVVMWKCMLQINIRNMEHEFLRNIHVWGSNIHVARSWLTPVYSRPQKQEHHWHPTVPAYEARQSPTRNTLVRASRTNNTYAFSARPRKILCQVGTSPKSNCPPAPAW